MEEPAAVRERTWPLVVLGALCAATSLVAIWWTTRQSVSILLWPPAGLQVCPAVLPVPGECTPERHVTVAALASGTTLLALTAVAFLSAKGRPGRGRVALAVLLVTGLLGYTVAAEPNRFLMDWQGPGAPGG